jgi:lysophospholipid acyltransferase (LPLAT)-like uncharacterized protein
MLRPFDSLIPFLARLLVRTWRVRLVGTENLSGGAVIGLWHQDLPASLAAFAHRGISVMVSQSQDGSLFAKICRKLDYKVFRGSGSRGSEAVRHLLLALAEGRSVGMALDGPRGPALAEKPGAAWLAQKSGKRLVRVRATYTHALRLNSWDRTWIPLPFSEVRVEIFF